MLGVYSSDYSLSWNRAILESICENGLQNPADLSRLHISCFGSVDQADSDIPSAHIHVLLQSTDTASVVESLHSDKGIFQIAQERRTDRDFPVLTFGRSLKVTQQLVAERLHNTVLFVLDRTHFAEHDKSNLILDLSSGERELDGPIPTLALKKAFVPKHLAFLFREIFPTQTVELETIKGKVLYAYPHSKEELSDLLTNLGFKKNGFGRISEREISDCLLPNYEKAIQEHIEEHIKKNPDEPLILHLVRLRAPTDQLLTEAKRDADLQDVKETIFADWQSKAHQAAEAASIALENLEKTYESKKTVAPASYFSSSVVLWSLVALSGCLAVSLCRHRLFKF